MYCINRDGFVGLLLELSYNPQLRHVQYLRPHWYFLEIDENVFVKKDIEDGREREIKATFVPKMTLEFGGSRKRELRTNQRPTCEHSV